MPTASEIEQWRKYRRQSVKALTGHCVFLAVAVGVLFAVRWWIGVPFWVWLVILGFAAWGLAGDVINIVHLGRRIAAEERTRA